MARIVRLACSVILSAIVVVALGLLLQVMHPGLSDRLATALGAVMVLVAWAVLIVSARDE